MKILLIEDSKYTAEAITYLTGLYKISIVHVEDSRKALATAKSEIFDKIVLDLMMPHLDGFQVFDLLRNDPETSNVPVLILTARIDKAQWDEDFMKKMRPTDSLMRKPFDNNELIRELRR
ncbi:hypothetical protein BVX95_01600 [archaeon D22]|nr:hypothetical protein BVX95_01600 [archaeon D22]